MKVLCRAILRPCLFKMGWLPRLLVLDRTDVRELALGNWPESSLQLRMFRW